VRISGAIGRLGLIDIENGIECGLTRRIDVHLNGSRVHLRVTHDPNLADYVQLYVRHAGRMRFDLKH
jgi:hypothetical protein